MALPELPPQKKTVVKEKYVVFRRQCVKESTQIDYKQYCSFVNSLPMLHGILVAL